MANQTKSKNAKSTSQESHFDLSHVRASCVLYRGGVDERSFSEHGNELASDKIGHRLLILLDPEAKATGAFHDYCSKGDLGLLCAFWSKRLRSVPLKWLPQFVEAILKAPQHPDRQRWRASIAEDDWRFTAQLIDIAQVSVTLPLLETFDQARGDVPNAGEILADIEAVQGPIIHKLNAWLSSFEGKTFPCEDAMRQVAEITSLVARAGCTLMHEGQPVSIYVTTPPDQKNATINVSTLGVRPQRTLLARTKVPRLSARPVAVE